MSQTNPIANPNPINSQALYGSASAADGTENAVSTASVTHAASFNRAAASAVMFNAQGQLVPASTSDSETALALPDVSGEQSSSGDAHGAVANWLTMNPGSLSQAMGMLSDIAAGNMQTMQKIRTEAGLNEYMTQEQSADQQVAQVQGERTSAWTKFTGAMIGGGLSLVAAAGGGAMGANSPTGAVAGFAAALSGLATPITQMTNSTTDLIDKTSGGQYQADQAKIAKAYLDMLVSIFKSQDDSFNSEVQNAQKSLQNVWDLTRSVNDQNSQTIINTGGNV
jgi:hypothetical protein